MTTRSPLEKLPFILHSPGVGAGRPAPAGWSGLVECPLLVMVGVTGVGKSTTLQELGDLLPFTLLPDRRVLTDELIIAAMRAADGEPPAAVRDRAQRFAYTRRFRDMFPGGMADLLPWLSVEAAPATRLLIFDGLRGENEVRAACAALPLAKFVLLDAPDAVRVSRLLGRADAFDAMGSAAATRPDSQALLPPEADAIFAPHEAAGLRTLVERGAILADDLRAKVEIVLEERRNYDPATTRAALETTAGERALVINTTHVSAQEAARRIAQAARAWFRPLQLAQP